MHEVGFEVLTAVVMKSSIFWDITPCSLLKVNRSFGGTYRLHLQGWKISRARTSVKAGGKQSNRLAEVLGYIRNRKEMDDKSVPIGSPVGQNEPPVPIGSHTQPSEPIGDRITFERTTRCYIPEDRTLHEYMKLYLHFRIRLHSVVFK
jgi:hypothetical protein